MEDILKQHYPSSPHLGSIMTPGLDLQGLIGGKDMQMSSNINEIASALSKVQGELDTAKKDSSGYGYNYSDLASVIETARPVLEKNDLAVTQLVGETQDGNAKVTTILTHSSGQYFRSEASIPVIEMKGTNAAQNFGASLSYLRRYAYQAILGMASEDNDASSKGPKKDSPVKKKKESTKKPAIKAKDVDGDLDEAPKKTSFRRNKKKQVEEDDI